MNNFSGLPVYAYSSLAVYNKRADLLNTYPFLQTVRHDGPAPPLAGPDRLLRPAVQTPQDELRPAEAGVLHAGAGQGEVAKVRQGHIRVQGVAGECGVLKGFIHR